MKKAAFLVLAFVLTAGSGFSWPWDKNENHSSNPFQDKVFITERDTSVTLDAAWDAFIFEGDSTVTRAHYQQFNTSAKRGTYVVDSSKKTVVMDLEGAGQYKYKYSVSGKIVRLESLEATITLYQIPTPVFWRDDSGDFNQSFKRLKGVEGGTFRKQFIDNLIAQIKGAPATTSAPTPTPPPISTPTGPPPPPIQIPLPIQPITIIQANGIAGPSHQIVPLDGEYRGKMANVAANFEREMVMKIKSAGAPQGTSPTLRVNAHVEVKKPDGLEEGDFSGFAIYGETTTVTLELDYEVGRGRIDAYAMGNFLVGQWQFFPKNNNKPSFGFLVLEKKK